eukprot:INCI3494.1.p1 GENE.INCI3494.1~~INCI3494.1.p1  ORF type:complete len:459 (-),score=84.72 INCI3494.1:366-1742(-)
MSRTCAQDVSRVVSPTKRKTTMSPPACSSDTDSSRPKASRQFSPEYAPQPALSVEPLVLPESAAPGPSSSHSFTLEECTENIDSFLEDDEPQRNSAFNRSKPLVQKAEPKQAPKQDPPRRPFEFPKPLLPSPAAAQAQCVEAIKLVVQRCREQEQRGDFAPNIGGAVRDLGNRGVEWREKVIEWLQLIVISRQGLHAGTVAAATSMLDAFVAKCRDEEVPRDPDHYELCGITAFVLACKNMENTAITRYIRTNFHRSRFSCQQMAAQEQLLMKTLSYHLVPTTVQEISSLLIDVFANLMNGGTRPSASVPAEADCARQVKRMEGITHLMLEIHLSAWQTVGISRPVMALGAVAAACHLCRLDFDALCAPLVGSVFTAEEVAQHHEFSHSCQLRFFETFPNIVGRSSSPQSVVNSVSNLGVTDNRHIVFDAAADAAVDNAVTKAARSTAMPVSATPSSL